ncbi:hypothetical protein AC578_1451 [Pseudocercospora eumusae]|uniref:Myb-like domain-containing protein n=1 Tax=Pseudocercospora eumusae TaxID=321146 RepID=A0A139GV04_9PEZI|nr:hypothetical protein AC578_1451 [Pseudocercospora eumusae]
MKLQALRKEAGLTPELPRSKAVRRIDQKRWSQDEYDIAIRLRNEGQSYVHIAETLGRSYLSVVNKFKAHNSPATHLWSKAEIEHVKKLRSLGMSSRDIHKAMSHRGGGRISDILRSISGGARAPAHRPWSDEESATLCDLRKQGKTWKEVALRLPGRSVLACVAKDVRERSLHDGSRLQ